MSLYWNSKRKYYPYDIALISNTGDDIEVYRSLTGGDEENNPNVGFYPPINPAEWVLLINQEINEMSKVNTRIKRVGYNFFPQYKKSGWFTEWQYITVRVPMSGNAVYHTVSQRDAELVIDKYLKSSDNTNGTEEIIVYPPASMQ